MMSAIGYSGGDAMTGYGPTQGELQQQPQHHPQGHQVDCGQTSYYGDQRAYDTPPAWTQNSADYGYGGYGGPGGYGEAAGVAQKSGNDGTGSYGAYNQRSSAHGYGQDGGETSGAYSGVYNNNSGRSKLPSETRVREGDWYCDSCNNFNFARRMECNRCRAPRSGAAGAGGATGGGRGGPPRSVGDWTCPGCNNLNFARRVECNRCRAPRPAEAKSTPNGGYSVAASSMGRTAGGGYGGGYGGGASSGYFAAGLEDYEQGGAGGAPSNYGNRESSGYRDIGQPDSYGGSSAAPALTNVAPYNYNAATAGTTAAEYSVGANLGSGQSGPGGAAWGPGRTGSSYEANSTYYGEGGKRTQSSYNDAPNCGSSFGASSIAYDGANKVEGEAEKSPDTIFVENLSHDVTFDDLVQFFGSIGMIKLDKKNNNKPKVWLYQDRVTGLPKGDATVTYDDPPSADAAISWFNGKEFKGRIIKVSKANLAKGTVAHRERHGGGRGGYGGAARGGSTQGRPGDWACESCNNSNFARRDHCYRCQAPKPAGYGSVGGYNSSSSGNYGGVGGYVAGGGSYGGPGNDDGECSGGYSGGRVYGPSSGSSGGYSAGRGGYGGGEAGVGVYSSANGGVNGGYGGRNRERSPGYGPRGQQGRGGRY